jgi:Flagellar hook-length control protein FliK
VQVTNQSAPVSGSPRVQQSLPNLAKAGEAETHTPFSAFLGEQVRAETVHAPLPVSSEGASDDARQETEEATASLPSDFSQPPDSPVSVSPKLPQPLPNAKALPNALNRPVQGSSTGVVDSLAEKPLPESVIPLVESKEKAVSSDHPVPAGLTQQRSKEEKHEDSAINGRSTAPDASAPLPVSHVTVAATNIGAAIPASLPAENVGLPLPASKPAAETPISVGHTPAVSGAVSTSASSATNAGDTGVGKDEKSGDVSSSGNSGPDLAASNAVTSQAAPLNSKLVASSLNDASSPQDSQKNAPLRVEGKRMQPADGDSAPVSSTSATGSGKLPASLPANAAQHSAPAQAGTPAQVTGMLSDGKHHDVIPAPAVNGAQSGAAAGSPASSTGMQGSENAAKPAAPQNAGANPFAKLDQDPNSDAIVLHSTAQRITVGVPHPSLGWVEINTQSAGDRIAATLVSASTQTHQHLAEQLPSLTQYLADREVKVSSLAVHQESAGSDGGGSSNAHNSQERDGGSSSRSKLQIDSAQSLQGDGRNEIQDGRRLSYIDIHA